MMNYRPVVTIALLIAATGRSPDCGVEPMPEPASKPPMGCISPAQAERDHGVADARRDLALGVLKLKALEHPGTPVEAIRADLLKKRFGIQHEVIGDDTTLTWILEAYAEAYNDVVREAIEAQHGKGILDGVAAEARLIHEIRNAIGSRTGSTLDQAARDAAEADLAAGWARLFSRGTATGIDAVHEELLLRELQVQTVVLNRPERDVWRFACCYNKKMKQALISRHGRHRWRRVAEEAAAEAAKRDIAAGKLKIVIYGMPMPSDLEYQRLLKTRFGIDVELGGCVLPGEYDIAHYNRPMRREIERRFGRGILEKTEADARLLHEQHQEGPAALRCMTAEEDAALNATGK
jgi:hypothetical protein